MMMYMRLRSRSLLLSAAAVFLIVAVSGVSEVRAQDEASRDIISGQYIVVFNENVEDLEDAEHDLLSRGRGVRLASYRSAIRGFAGQFSDSAIEEIRHDPRIAFVSEDRIVSLTAERSDRSEHARVEDAAAREYRRWNPKPSPSPTPAPTPPANTQVLPSGINRINAENKTNTGEGQVVAIIDTGVDVNHADLKANMYGGKNCTSMNTSAYGDENGHGTHVAGTIAALNNTIGVVGIAPRAKIASIRVLDRFGNGSWSSVICGLDAVAANGPARGGVITVANMSLGGSGSNDNNCGLTNNDALHMAVCRVRDAGVTLIVAAGNSGKDTASFVPAAYNDAVITVSALVDTDGVHGGAGVGTSYGADDTFASFSNFGTAVDIGAPGVNIYSTRLGGGYTTMSGTSMAAPHVAGAAALYLANNPGAAWTVVRDALVSSAEVLGSLHSDPSGKHPEPIVRADAL